jgi:hypothetical protein
MGLDKRGKSREYLDGYRDGVNDAWDDVLKMASKGYTSQEFQIMIKSRRYAMLKDVDPGTAHPDERGAQGRSPQRKEDGDVRLVPGTSYLVKEVKPDGAYALFAYAIKTGMKGICIARTPPEVVKTRYKVPEAKVVWLVSTGGSESTPLPPSALGLSGSDFGGQEETAAPDRMPWIFTMLSAFMDANKGSGAIIIDGLEYLIANNGFKGVMGFIQQVNETASSRKCVLIIPVSPSTMDPREFAQLEKEMGETVDGSG